MMDNKTNAKRSAQLGMSHSTARSRLVKMLLFRELQRSANNFCFKCGDEIDDIDHLSIEHKLPWLDVDPALYWDLDNIEYSHLKCNRPHRFNKPFTGPDGTYWCVGHQAFLNESEFHNNATRTNGKSQYCKACRNKGGVVDSHKSRGRSIRWNHADGS